MLQAMKMTWLALENCLLALRMKHLSKVQKAQDAFSLLQLRATNVEHRRHMLGLRSVPVLQPCLQFALLRSLEMPSKSRMVPAASHQSLYRTLFGSHGPL